MTAPTAPSIEAFLDSFFSSPNRLARDSKVELLNWIARIVRPEPLSTVLPCWRESGAIDWYGIAFDDRQFRALGEWLTAFVGPTYTNFRGQIAQLDTSDPIDKAVCNFTNGRAYRFRGGDPKQIWIALERLRMVTEQSGPRERTVPAPVGRVLRDFHMAIRAGLESDAEATLNYLRDQYHLDGLNQLFLRVELLASFGHWQSLLDLRETPDLLRLRKPVAVTEALLRGVYQCYLANFETPANPERAIQTFATTVLPTFGQLMANRAGMRSAEAAKCFVMNAATQPPLDPTQREELRAGWDLSGDDARYLDQLLQVVKTNVESRVDDTLSLAANAAQAGDYDRVLALLRTQSASLIQTRLLCECAFELDTIDSRAVAIRAVDGLSAEDRNEFLGRRVNLQLWQGIQDVGTSPKQDKVAATDSLPTDWISWLDYLVAHEGRRGAREIAHRGSTEWSVLELLNRPDGAATLAEKLHNLDLHAAESALRDSLPHLLAFFQRDDNWPNPLFRDVYRVLFERIYLSSEGSRSDWIVITDLLECMLSMGFPKASDYEESVQCAADLCHQFLAPATIDNAIDLLGVLVIHPCQSTNVRAGFLQTLLESLNRFTRRVRVDQRLLLQLLAIDIQEGDLVAAYLPSAESSADAPPDPLKALSQMSVAIYSLTESSARQVLQLLEATYPGVKIALSSDLAGTPRLKQLARQSDLFVMVTASAKHAATEFITANRPKEMPLLRPNGKGASSMLAAIRDHFASPNE